MNTWAQHHVWSHTSSHLIHPFSWSWILMASDVSSPTEKRWCKLSYIFPINTYQLQSNSQNKCKTIKYCFDSVYAYPDVAMVSCWAGQSTMRCLWQVHWQELGYLEQTQTRTRTQLVPFLKPWKIFLQILVHKQGEGQIHLLRKFMGIYTILEHCSDLFR